MAPGAEHEEQGIDTSPTRPATSEDLVTTARIHGAQLPDGFFVRFGPGFLAAYHGRFRRSPHAVVLVAGPVDGPTAFLVGSLDNVAHYRWMVRHPLPLLAGALRSATVRPRLAVELVHTRGRRYLRGILRLLRRRARPAPSATRRAARTDAASTPAQGHDVVAVLTHVAVSQAAEGTGLGRALVEDFVTLARAHGAAEIRLISAVGTAGPGFYRRLGWWSLGDRAAADGTLVEEFRFPL